MSEELPGCHLIGQFTINGRQYSAWMPALHFPTGLEGI